MSKGEVLKIRNLESGYGRKRVIKKLNLSLREGEKIGIKGDNGVGKSTLFKSIFGAAKIFSGRITFQNECITSIPPWKTFEKGIFYIPQNEDVFNSLDLLEHSRLFSINNQLFKQHIKEHSELKAENLSGGQKRLLSLLRMSSTNKNLLLLDEPSRSLSHKNIEFLNQFIQNIDESVSVIIIEQDWDSLNVGFDRKLKFSNEGRLE